MRGFFSRLLYRLQVFMQGRYGVDNYYYFLLAVYVLLILVNAFANSGGIYLASLIILFYALFRILSKNIPARQRENTKYLTVKHKVTKTFRQIKDRAKDKDHFYKKCPHCRATLRLPRKKGRHNVNCPRCKRDFSVTVLFGKP